jgi:hypothetical protein
MILKESTRGVDESPLLGPGDAVCTTAVAVIFPVSNLGKYQRTPVQHDQVDLTETRMEVTFQRFETPLVQKGFGNLFPVAASLTACGHAQLLSPRWNRVPQRHRTAPDEFSPGWFPMKCVLVG